MAKYKAVRYFTDRLDKEHPYQKGDIYPREGLDVSDDRLAELSGNKNRLGQPVIEKVEEVEQKKTTRRKKKEV